MTVGGGKILSYAVACLKEIGLRPVSRVSLALIVTVPLSIASATSTGGRGFEFPGRVSDSGMPVANYADLKCAVSATGIGEEIIDEGLAIKIATRVGDGATLREAFERTFREIRSRNRRIGAIGLDWKGNLAYQTTTEVLIYGWRKGGKFSVFA